MARTISDEELQLKQRARRRLIGAVVLVTAIVVVLPMVLDSEPNRTAGSEISVQIPSPDSGAFTSRVVPSASAPSSAPAPRSDPRPEPKSESRAEDSSKPTSSAISEEPRKLAVAPTPVPSAKETPGETFRAEPPKPVEKPAAEPAKQAPAKDAAKPAPKPKNGQYVVQVIALADAGRAKQMQQQIAGAGIKSYTEVVKTSKGEVTRVRAGPFATRAAAEKARDQLKALGMSGNVATK